MGAKSTRSPSDVLEERVRSALLARGDEVSEKPMFGGTTFLLRSHMLCCVSSKGLMVRVGAAAEAEALLHPHAASCLGTGRYMAGFIIVAPDGLVGDRDVAQWLDRALAYVDRLPAKGARRVSAGARPGNKIKKGRSRA